MTIDPIKYMTTANWLRGYAEGLQDKERHSALIHKLLLASELLMAVWEEKKDQDA